MHPGFSPGHFALAACDAVEQVPDADDIAAL